MLITLSVIMGVLALLADMLGRHRRISEELLFLARRRIYANRRTSRIALPGEDAGRESDWAPVMRSVSNDMVEVSTEAIARNGTPVSREEF